MQIRDIDRVQQTDRTQESDELFRTMFDVASMGMAQVDLQTGRWVRVNRKYCDITGYSESEMLEMSIPEITHPEDREEDEKALQRVVRGEAADYRLEKRYIRKDGRIVWVNVNVTVIRNEEGEPVRTVAIIEDISSRKETEQKLRESEEKFRKAFHTNQESISVNRLSDGKYVLINQGFTKATGYSEEEVIGKTSSDIKIWAEAEDRQHLVEGFRKNWRVENFETSFRRKNGEIQYALLSASLIDLEGIPHILSVTRDITQQKEAEKRIRQSEEKYRILVENAIESVYLVQDGRLRYANPETERLFGYSKEELGSTLFAHFIHPDDRDLVIERYLRRQKGYPVPSRYSFRILHSSGETRWVELNVVLVEWEGRPATLNFLTDITARKVAEAELERAHDFIKNIEDACFEMDLSGNLIFCNEPFLQYTGYARDEYKALTHWQRHPTPEEARRVIQIYQEVYRTGLPAISVEFQNLRKDGSVTVAEVSIYLIRDKSGRPVGFRGVGRDVTDRKRQEEEKKKMEERLQRSEKMEALGTLAGGIAHDFNNILGSMIGYTEMTLQRDLPDARRARHNLEQVLKSGARAKDLVSRILTFSRRQVQEKRPVRIIPVVDEALRLLRASLPSTIRIRKNISAENDCVLGDPVQFHQIMMNLCTNAAHAINGNGGALEISIINRELDPGESERLALKPGRYLQLSVSDTGCGIAPEILPRIFEPFFSTKKNNEGTGLGLSVVYGIVKGCGGAVSVDSRPGEGTRFDLYFPVAAKIAGNTCSPFPIEPNLPKGTERILFVDDESALANVGREMLGLLGYDAIAVTSSSEALDIFRAQSDRIDLVITDYTMPAMTGADLTKAILQIRPETPVILATGYSEIMTREKARALGIRELIMKPFFIRDLAATIRKVLDP